MMNFVWKIIDLVHDGESLTGAYYHITASDDQNTVETEGQWKFSKPHSEIEFSEIEESLIIRWIEEDDMKDGINTIKSNLEKQLQALKSAKSGLPWVKPTFKPNIGL
jgi:hypothetical protein